MFHCRIVRNVSFMMLNLMTVAMAIDVYLSRSRYTWDDAMNQMPCTIVDEKTEAQMQKEPVNILNFDGQLVIKNTEAWIGAYFWQEPEISFSGLCYYVYASIDQYAQSVYRNQLLECYLHCANSTFWIVTRTCFCDINVESYINKATSNTCSPQICSGESGSPFQCGYVYASHSYCLCQYYSQVSTIGWGLPPKNIQRSGCKKAVKQRNRISPSLEYCSQSLPVLCGSLNEKQDTKTTSTTGTAITNATDTTLITRPSTTVVPVTQTTTSVTIPVSRGHGSSSSSGGEEMVNTTIPLRPSDNSFQKSKSNGLYIGILGSAGCILVLVVLTVLVIVVKKRTPKRKTQPESTEYNLEQTQYSDIQSGYSEIVLLADDTADHEHANIATGQCELSKNNEKRTKTRIVTGESTVEITDSIYNVLHEKGTYEDVPCDTYDHVPDRIDSEYDTLNGSTHTRDDPVDLTQYDSMASIHDCAV